MGELILNLKGDNGSAIRGLQWDQDFHECIKV